MKQIILVSGLMRASPVLLAPAMAGPQGESAAGQFSLAPAQQRATIQKHLTHSKAFRRLLHYLIAAV
ncbi:hypothetical protein [Deefgea sp. CFH1-16]|uniref:hypothetical protein n=1 Tax=Deefgea sp. CFH1-16 TaxID=2675457 RepID=UPI0015F54F2C|nr:hypothetical protein [Deefgea sp. CFH1-16]MBM5574683.1 hypothetical protein [Deefgea sp. CFH1-16]